MRGNLTGEGAAAGALGSPVWAAAALTGAGLVGRPRGGLGWGLAAGKEVGAEGSAQVLAVTVAGLITEG